MIDDDLRARIAALTAAEEAAEPWPLTVAQRDLVRRALGPAARHATGRPELATAPTVATAA